MLTMTAGRRFLISPPSEGSKLTHHISPRFIGDIPHRRLGPLGAVGLAGLVQCHLPVRGREIFADSTSVRADEGRSMATG